MSQSDPPNRKPKASRDPKEAGAYLKRVLKMNPLADAERMISLRQQFVGQGDKAVVSNSSFADPHQREQLREQVQNHLDEIRGAFWKAPAASLQKKLRSLPVDDFPDLKAAAGRLNSVLGVRESIDALRGDEDFHVNLFNMIRRLMTLGPAKAGELKGTYLFDLARSDHLKDARLMAKSIRQCHPQVYQLESAWFDQIIKTRRRKLANSTAGGFGEDIDGGNYGCLFMIAAYVVIKILISIARSMGN